jgi:hypothetical protein
MTAERRVSTVLCALALCVSCAAGEVDAAGSTRPGIAMGSQSVVGASPPDPAAASDPESRQTPDPTNPAPTTSNQRRSYGAATDPTAGRTPEPTARSAEADAAESIERFFGLALEARGPDPGHDALDVEAYATGDLAASLRQTLVDELAGGVFVTGSAELTSTSTRALSTGSVIVEGCLVTSLTESARTDGRVLRSSGEVAAPAIARAVEIDGVWLPAALEIGEPPCDD